MHAHYQSFPKGLETVEKKKDASVLCSNYLTVSKKPESPVLAGESVSLDCRAESPAGQTKPQIHWLDQHGDRVEGSKATYTFSAADKHNGQWTCVVTKGVTLGSGKISVSVAGEFQCGGAGGVLLESTPTLSSDSSSLMTFFGGNRKSLTALSALLAHILTFPFIKFNNRCAYSWCG